MEGAEEVAAYFAANLRRLRRAAGLSQEEVGRCSSLHRTEVGLLERAARVPKVDTLIKVASAIGVSPAQLLDGISWTPAEIGETKPGQFKHNPDSSQQSQQQGAQAEEEGERGQEGPGKGSKRQ